MALAGSVGSPGVGCRSGLPTASSRFLAKVRKRPLGLGTLLGSSWRLGHTNKFDGARLLRRFGLAATRENNCTFVCQEAQPEGNRGLVAQLECPAAPGFRCGRLRPARPKGRKAYPCHLTVQLKLNFRDSARRIDRIVTTLSCDRSRAPGPKNNRTRIDSPPYRSNLPNRTRLPGGGFPSDNRSRPEIFRQTCRPVIGQKRAANEPTEWTAYSTDRYNT